MLPKPRNASVLIKDALTNYLSTKGLQKTKKKQLMEEKLAQILSDKSLPQNSEKNFISWSNLCDENFVSQVLPNKA